MKLEILDVNRFAEANRLSPVTDPIFLGADGGPTPGGLFSAEIFGRPGSEDRRRRWAYIDLGGRFLHPLIYKTCTQLDRKFAEIVAGARYVTLGRTGVILDAEVDEELGPPAEAWTGVDALYLNWSKINWGASAAGGQREQRTGLLRAVPRELAFVTKWPVMPALFRDVDTGVARGGRIREIPPINYLYVQLLTTAPSVVSGFAFADGARKRRAQNVLVELNQSCLALIASKHGLIQERILGKYSDWAVQSVISGPAVAKANRPSEQEVPFGYVGVPLYLAVNLFQPFVIKQLGDRFRALAGGQERIRLQAAGASEAGFFELTREVRAQLNADTYKRWIGRFMRSQENRLDTLSVTTGLGEEVALPLYDEFLGRPTTLTDLFYLTASDVVADKHVMFTRYPIEDFRACHFAKVAILTTETTEDMTLRDTRYPRYPSAKPPVRWVDSIRLNNSYTEAMGADYDGDRVRMFGLFTQEANAEAAAKILSATNFCDGQGRPSRVVKNEAVLTFYSLTA